MSDPVTNVQIEDVLSSIRRLVSEEAAPRAACARASDALAEPERLVLTPAQRVVEPELVSEPLRLADVSRPLDLGSVAEVWDAGQGAGLPGGAESADKTDKPDKSDKSDNFDAEPEESHRFDVDPDDDAPDKEHAEATPPEIPEVDMAAIGALIGRAIRPHPDDEPDAAFETKEPSAPFEETADTLDTPDVDAAPDWVADLHEEGAEAEPAPMPGSDAAVSLDDADPQARRTLETTVAELETMVGQSDQDWEPDALPLESADLLDWDDYLDDEVEANPTPKADPVALADDTPASDDTLVGAAAAAADLNDVLNDETSLIDEDMLRDMVAEIVRQELQGSLGERITRNVRKLVRREIHRALASQDFE